MDQQRVEEIILEYAAKKGMTGILQGWFQITETSECNGLQGVSEYYRVCRNCSMSPHTPAWKDFKEVLRHIWDLIKEKEILERRGMESFPVLFLAPLRLFLAVVLVIIEKDDVGVFKRVIEILKMVNKKINASPGKCLLPSRFSEIKMELKRRIVLDKMNRKETAEEAYAVIDKKFPDCEERDERSDRSHSHEVRQQLLEVVGRNEFRNHVVSAAEKKDLVKKVKHYVREVNDDLAPTKIEQLSSPNGSSHYEMPISSGNGLPESNRFYSRLVLLCMDGLPREKDLQHLLSDMWNVKCPKEKKRRTREKEDEDQEDELDKGLGCLRENLEERRRNVPKENKRHDHQSGNSSSDVAREERYGKNREEANTLYFRIMKEVMESDDRESGSRDATQVERQSSDRSTDEIQCIAQSHSDNKNHNQTWGPQSDNDQSGIKASDFNRDQSSEESSGDQKDQVQFRIQSSEVNIDQNQSLKQLCDANRDGSMIQSSDVNINQSRRQSFDAHVNRDGSMIQSSDVNIDQSRRQSSDADVNRDGSMIQSSDVNIDQSRRGPSDADVNRDGSMIQSSDVNIDQSKKQSSDLNRDQSRIQSSDVNKDQSTEQSSDVNRDLSRIQSSDVNIEQSRRQSFNVNRDHPFLQLSDVYTDQPRDQSFDFSTNQNPSDKDQSGIHASDVNIDQSREQSSDVNRDQSREQLSDVNRDQSREQSSDVNRDQSREQSYDVNRDQFRIQSRSRRRLDDVIRDLHQSRKKSSDVDIGQNQSRRHSSAVVRDQSRSRRWPVDVSRDQKQSRRWSSDVSRDHNQSRRQSSKVKRDKNQSRRHSCAVMRDQSRSRRWPVDVSRDHNQSRRRSSDVSRDQNRSRKRSSDVSRDQYQSRRPSSAVMRDESRSRRWPVDVNRDQNQSRRRSYDVKRDQDISQRCSSDVTNRAQNQNQEFDEDIVEPMDIESDGSDFELTQDRGVTFEHRKRSSPPRTFQASNCSVVLENFREKLNKTKDEEITLGNTQLSSPLAECDSPSRPFQVSNCSVVLKNLLDKRKEKRDEEAILGNRLQSSPLSECGSRMLHVSNCSVVLENFREKVSKTPYEQAITEIKKTFSPLSGRNCTQGEVSLPMCSVCLRKYREPTITHSRRLVIRHNNGPSIFKRKKIIRRSINIPGYGHVRLSQNLPEYGLYI